MDGQNRKSIAGRLHCRRINRFGRGAVLQEFEAFSQRGARAMETMYQRGKIQDESMYYEHLKHDGTLPIGRQYLSNPNASAFDESSARLKWSWLGFTPEENKHAWTE